MKNERTARDNFDPGDYYNEFAPKYKETAEAAGWPEKAASLIARTFGHKSAETIQSVLDLGAGTGDSMTAIRAGARPSRTVLVDPSEEMLRRNKHITAPGTRTITAKAEDFVGNSSEQFDLITAMSFLEFVPDLPSFLERAAKLLRRDGLFAFTYVPLEEDMEREEILYSPGLDRSLHEYRWTPEEVTAGLEAGGLKVVERFDHLVAYELGDETVRYNFVICGAAS